MNTQDQIAQELNSAGDGMFQLRLVLILGLGNAADAVEVLCMGYILTKFEQLGESLTVSQQSFISAAVFAGMFIGGLIFGAFSDRIGRRKSLLLALFINGFAAIAASVAPSINMLILCRIIAGIGVGGSVPSLFTLCSEFAPSNSRGYYITIVASFWMVGSIFTAGLAWVMLEDAAASSNAWRPFAAIIALPAFSCFLLSYFFVPESPMYLASKERYDEAREVISIVRYVNGKEKQALLGNFGTSSNNSSSSKANSSSAFKVKVFNDDIESMEDLQVYDTIAEGFQQLFHPIVRVPTLCLIVLWFCLSFGFYGLSTWISVLFNRIGFKNPYSNAFLYSCANLPGNIASAYLLDRIGRKKVLTGGMVGASICAALFALCNNYNSRSIIVLLAMGFNAFSIAAWNAVDIMSTEYFPTTIRTTGMGVLSCGGRVGSTLAQFVNGYFIGPPLHISALLIVTSLVMFTGGFATFALKDNMGKPLFKSFQDMKERY